MHFGEIVFIGSKHRRRDVQHAGHGADSQQHTRGVVVRRGGELEDLKLTPRGFSLTGNEITDVGVAALARTVARNRTLKNL